MRSKGHKSNKSNKLFNMRGGIELSKEWGACAFLFGFISFISGIVSLGYIVDFNARRNLLQKEHPTKNWDSIKDITARDYFKQSKDITYQFYHSTLHKTANHIFNSKVLSIISGIISCILLICLGVSLIMQYVYA
jgi:hypothetical protein